MVLGTALSALGTTTGLAAASEPQVRAIQDISRYCTVCWRNARLHPDSWTDCTQEVFCRLLERVAPDAWSDVLKDESQERREFIRAIDTVKKRVQRGHKYLGYQPDAVVDGLDLHRRTLKADRQAVEQAAAQVLSPRQRRIMELSFDGWSVHEIAAKLNLPAERVSDEKYKAVRKLRSCFAV
jgi:RNA polymerase sigma factor (sigma-70 family)